MADLSEIMTALRNADKAGDMEAARRLAKIAQGFSRGPDKSVPDSEDAISGTRNLDKPDTASLMDKAKGYGEAALSLGSGVVGGLAGNVAGLARGLHPSNYGTREGGEEAKGRAAEVAHSLTYQPRTEQGQSTLQDIGNLLSASKLEGLGPMAGPGTVALSEVAPQVSGMVRGGVNRLRDVTRAKEPQMVGVGSALADVEQGRIVRAESLPVPIKLTKGQSARAYEQQQFEREVSKDSRSGGPLRERFAEQNDAILKNFDAWVDQTGAEAGSLRATGQAVTDAIAKKAQKAKGEINAAYEKAREAGAMSELVDPAPLMKYVIEHEPEAVNAGVITALGAKVKSLSSGGGKDIFGQQKPKGISVNDLEEVRKMVGALSQKDATNAHFGKEIRQMIDSLTENAGGPEYRKARALRAGYANEFENVGVIDKMLSTKPGTKDRAVAYEDVFKHSILSGSLDDVRAVRKTLQTAGAEGEQAWKELQGATIQHMKDEVTKSVALDIRGNPIVSPARLDRLVKELDKDGKLDFIFGKKGAQQVRDVNDLAKDVYTSPPGSVNHSNTSSALLNALGSIAMGRLPTAAGYAVNALKGMRETRLIENKVRASLHPEIAGQKNSISLKELADLSRKRNEALQ